MAASPIQRFRFLLLAAIVITIVATGRVYISKLHKTDTNRLRPPERMGPSINQTAQHFAMSHESGGKTTFKATAERAVDYRDTGKSHLEGVNIFIYGAKGDRNDHITSKSCDYDSNAEQFFCDEEVDIQLNSLPGQVSEASSQAKPVVIKTTGMSFDQKSGIAQTDRRLDFDFKNGTGEAVGAVYDSGARTLWLKSNVIIHDHRGTPVDIYAADLHYLQLEHRITFTKPEMRRVGQKIAANSGILYLDEKDQAKSAVMEGAIHGITDNKEKARHTDFVADRLEMALNDKQQVQTALATGNVRVDSQSPTGGSRSQAARVEMTFNGGKENVLEKAAWKGGAKAIFTPAPNQAKGQTRIISAEHLEMQMKADGKEVANARTVTPGQIEMLGGSEPRRVLTAQRIWTTFGEHNTLRELHAQDQVRTDSDPPPPAPGSKNKSTDHRITTCDRLAATFNTQGQLQTMEQTGNFRYVEGDRKATGETALYQIPAGEQTGTTVLTGTAAAYPVVMDPQNRVTAKRITLPEKGGEALAEQDVKATQLPSNDDKSPQKRPAILAGSGNKKDGKSSDDPIHALTNRLRWDRQSGVSHYESGPGGKARLWQGQDVLEARTIDTERSGKKLIATGDVFSYLAQEGKDPLRVWSSKLTYSDDDRVAHYDGGVTLVSQDMTMKSQIVDAWFRAADEVGPGESRLDRAVANGKVHMNQPPRVASEGKKAHAARSGESDRAVYTSEEEKLVLTGGPPVVRDDVQGSITGRELTWLTTDDKLFVDGGPDVRALTQHRMAKKPMPQPPH